MESMLEHLNEGFSLYLAAGVMFSCASVWAAVKAARSDNGRGHR